MSTDAAPARRRHATWVVVALSGAFGLFYAYVVWNAVDLLVNQVGHPLGLNAYGWAVYLAAVVFPLLAFGVAFALGHRRRLDQFALLLLTGLALSFVFWLNIVSYGVVSFALYGA